MEVKKQEKKKDYASDRLSAMQLELKTTKYNKRTQGSVGLLKAKIARAKEDLTKRASSGKKGEGYFGDASGTAGGKGCERIVGEAGGEEVERIVGSKC